MLHSYGDAVAGFKGDLAAGGVDALAVEGTAIIVEPLNNELTGLTGAVKVEKVAADSGG